MALNKPDIGRFANFLAKIMKLFVNRSISTFLYAINLSLGYFLFEKKFSHKKIQAATKKPDAATFIFLQNCKQGGVPSSDASLSVRMDLG